MFAARCLAIIWLLGGTYILIRTGFSPGIFGGVTAALAIPAGIGILAGRRWAIVPALLLAVAWAGIGMVLIFLGSGMTANNVVLLVGGVLSGMTVLLAYRTRGQPPPRFDLE